MIRLNFKAIVVVLVVIMLSASTAFGLLTYWLAR